MIYGYDSQEFISKHIKPYYDIFHGYWMGLRETEDKSWVWVDGSNDTLRYDNNKNKAGRKRKYAISLH